MSSLITDREALRVAQRIIEAQQALLVAYRTGGRTPGKAIDTLRREVPKWDEWRANAAAEPREILPCPACGSTTLTHSFTGDPQAVHVHQSVPLQAKAQQ